MTEGDAELRVSQERSGLPDRFGCDQRIVAAVHVGEEAVSARPLGGDAEVLVVHAFPVGQHDLGDTRPVDEFLGNSGGQRPVEQGTSLDGGHRVAFDERRAGFHIVHVERARRHSSP